MNRNRVGRGSIDGCLGGTSGVETVGCPGYTDRVSTRECALGVRGHLCLSPLFGSGGRGSRGETGRRRCRLMGVSSKMLGICFLKSLLRGPEGSAV